MVSANIVQPMCVANHSPEGFLWILMITYLYIFFFPVLQGFISNILLFR
jgi:hypothetical protein